MDICTVQDGKCWDLEKTPSSYPACLLVLFLQQVDELAEALLHGIHVVYCASLEQPALPPSQRFQFEIFLYLFEEMEGGLEKSGCMFLYCFLK